MQAPDKYFETVHKKCLRHFDAFCSNGDAEDMHGMRVSIKRISALLKMANKTKADFRLRKSYKAYKDVFKHGGRIREAQLQLRELKRTKALQSETRRLTNLVNKEIKEFKANCTAYRNALEGIYHKLPGELKAIKTKKLEKYFAGAHNKIKARSYGISISSLHGFRKLLKQFIYNSVMMPKAQQKQLHLKTLIPFMDKMQDLIGAWHDKDILITSLQHLKKTTAPASLIKKEEKQRDRQLIKLEVMFAQLRLLMEQK